MAGQSTLELINSLQERFKTNGIDPGSDSKPLKKQACDLAYKIFRDLEKPGDMVTRILSQSIENSLLLTGIHLDIFEYLLQASDNVRSKDVAAKTGAEEALVYRILRFLAAHRFIDEVDVDHFKANETTKAFTSPKAIAGLDFSVNIGIPTWQSLPAYFKSMNYQTPTDPLKAPLQYAFKSDKHFFDILVEQNAMTNFQTFMSDYRADRAELLDIYPADKNLIHGDDGDSIFFVDVGGGRGHEIDKVLERFPQEKHRVVLQDLPYVVKEVEGATNKEVMVYDFFTLQPVKGARCYHFRMILHDWPDDHCVKILQNTASVMKAGYSKILISDVVLPDKGATAWPTESDFGMMSLLAAMERSAAQWTALLERAGLKLIKIYPSIPESVLEVELA